MKRNETKPVAYDLHRARLTPFGGSDDKLYHRDPENDCSASAGRKNDINSTIIWTAPFLGVEQTP